MMSNIVKCSGREAPRRAGRFSRTAFVVLPATEHVAVTSARHRMHYRARYWSHRPALR